MPEIVSATYGDYDCEANSIVYWLERLGLSTESFLYYNWDFYLDEEKDILRGSVPILKALYYIEEQYNIGIKRIPLCEVMLGDPLIIPVNAFMLSYAEDYHMKRDWTHYFPATLASAQAFNVWDPVLKFVGKCPLDEVSRGWEAYGDPVICLSAPTVLISPGRSRHSNIGAMNASRYADTLNRFIRRLRSMLGESTDLSSDYTFKKYFGNLQSIYKSRMLHFTASDANLAMKESMSNGWKRVIKSYTRMMVVGDAALQETIRSLEDICHEELNYIQSLQ